MVLSWGNCVQLLISIDLPLKSWDKRVQTPGMLDGVVLLMLALYKTT